jgi:hypothetical protein
MKWCYGGLFQTVMILWFSEQHFLELLSCLVIEIVLPGREFFVGLSEWTNEAGARAVAAAFPEFPCTPVKVRPCVDPDESRTVSMQAPADAEDSRCSAHVTVLCETCN